MEEEETTRKLRPGRVVFVIVTVDFDFDSLVDVWKTLNRRSVYIEPVVVYTEDAGEYGTCYKLNGHVSVGARGDDGRENRK
jgi:hypothetical protein